MKKLLLAASLMLATSTLFAQAGTDYGEAVKTKKAITVDECKAKLLAAETWSGVITGKVFTVCKAEGCWLRLEDGSKSGMLVKMKNHAFVVPKNIEGKTIYIAGQATRKTTSVEQQKHYAKDAGKSQEEIDAIKEPVAEIIIEATGVKIMD